MKKGILVVVLLLFICISWGQEIIENGSFENVKTGHTFQNTQGKIADCDGWRSRYVQSGAIPLHSPDWSWSGHQTFPLNFAGVQAHKGAKYVNGATGNFELIYQEVPTILSGFYIINFWVRANSNYQVNGYHPFEPFQPHNNKITIYLAENEFEFKSETSEADEVNCSNDYKEFKSNNILTFDYSFDLQKLYDRQEWVPIEIVLNVPSSNMKWIGVMYGGNDYPYCMDDVTENGDFLNFDDFSLRRASCFCPLEEWIQNVDYPNSLPFSNYYVPESHIIQASEVIKAGYDVGLLNPTPGNVIVESGYNLTYRAGNTIELLPGFQAKPGSLFSAIIGACEYKTGDITLITHPPSFVPYYTGSQGYPNIFGFICSGATDFVLHLYNNLGQLAIDVSGQVPADGRVLIDNSYWDDWPCDQAYVGVLTLSNCEKSITIPIGTIAVCVSSVSKKDLSNLDSIESERFELKVFPQPISNSFTINLSCSEGIGASKAEVFDVLGNLILKGVDLSTENKTITKEIDFSGYPSGTYQIRVHTDKGILTQRILKI